MLNKEQVSIEYWLEISVSFNLMILIAFVLQKRWQWKFQKNS